MKVLLILLELALLVIPIQRSQLDAIDTRITAVECVSQRCLYLPLILGDNNGESIPIVKHVVLKSERQWGGGPFYTVVGELENQTENIHYYAAVSAICYDNLNRIVKKVSQFVHFVAIPVGGVGPFRISLSGLTVPVTQCSLTVDEGIVSSSIVRHELAISNIIYYPGQPGSPTQYDFTITNNSPDLINTVRYVATTYDVEGNVVNVSPYTSFGLTFISGTTIQRGVNVGTDPFITVVIRAEGDAS